MPNVFKVQNRQQQHNYTLPNARVIQHIIDGYTDRKAAINSKLSQMNAYGLSGSIDTYGNELIDETKFLGKNDSQKGFAKSSTKIIPLSKETETQISDYNRRMGGVDKLNKIGLNLLGGVDPNGSQTTLSDTANIVKDLNSNVLVGNTDQNNKQILATKVIDAKQLLKRKDDLASLMSAASLGIQNDLKNGVLDSPSAKLLEGYKQEYDRITNTDDMNKAELITNNIDQTESTNSKKSKRISAATSSKKTIKVGQKVNKMSYEQLAITTTETKKELIDDVPFSMASLYKASARMSLLGIPDNQNLYLDMIKRKREFLKMKAKEGATQYDIKINKSKTILGGGSGSVQYGADSKNEVKLGDINVNNKKPGSKQKISNRTLIDKGGNKTIYGVYPNGSSAEDVTVNKTNVKYKTDEDRIRSMNKYSTALARSIYTDPKTKEMFDNKSSVATASIGLKDGSGKIRDFSITIPLYYIKDLGMDDNGRLTAQTANAVIKKIISENTDSNGNINADSINKSTDKKTIILREMAHEMFNKVKDSDLSKEEIDKAIEIYKSMSNVEYAKTHGTFSSITYLDGNGNTVASTSIAAGDNDTYKVRTFVAQGFQTSTIQDITGTSSQ